MKPKSDQARRFEEAARSVDADETGESFERAFAKIVPPKHRPLKEPKPKRGPGATPADD
ncbi:MAG TPA: hypothetical protein V6D47_17410 [Oscillatoriaceae cyanobacterium]